MVGLHGWGARLFLVEAMLNLDQVKECEADLKDLLSENRWVAEAWDLLGTAAAGLYDLAAEEHKKALEIDPPSKGAGDFLWLK